MEPVLDVHTHAQNVFGMCCVPPVLRPVMKHGLARLYEKTGFNPLMKKAESPLSMQFIVREVQSRFATFTFEDYLAAMKRNGVTHACALPVEPMATTDELLAMVAGHPEVIPFASVDFEKPDPAGQLRGHLGRGCAGVKIHPIMQNIDPDDERIHAVFAELKGSGVPVIFHTGRMHYYLGRKPEDPSLADPERFLPLLQRYPKQPVIFGHMGMLDADPAIGIAAEHDNVYLEVSFQPATVIQQALATLGHQRILLGSDWPASEARTEMGLIDIATRGNQEARRNLLFHNAAELLQRGGIVDLRI